MTTCMIDRRSTVYVHPTSQGYTFQYQGKTHKRRTLESIHQFFLKQSSLDTIKLRLPSEKYYLHFTLDEPEKFSTKRELRSVLTLESGGAWIEEKNGKLRYLIEEGWLFLNVREVSENEFTAHQSSSVMQKVAKLAFGILSLVPQVARSASVLSNHCSGVGLLGFSFLQASSALAQMPAFGEFRINTNTLEFVNTTTTGENSRSRPKLTGILDGGFVAAWMSNLQDGSGYGVYGQKYDAAGFPVGPEFRVNTYTISGQYYPSLAGLPDGGFVVAWQSDAQDGDLGGIYGQRYNTTGLPVGSEFRINTNTTNTQQWPTLATLTNGGFVAAWESVQNGVNSDIYGQRYNETGFPLGPEFRINPNTTNNQWYPTITGLTDGGFTIAWQSNQNVLEGWDVYGLRYNALGAPVGSEFRINTNTTSDQVHPTITGLTDGGFVVAWMSNFQDGSSYGIYAQRYDTAGSPIGAEFRINNSTMNNQDLPTLVGLTDGGFVAAWESNLQDGSSYGIYGQKYNASGLLEGTEFRINTNTTDSQGYPTLARLTDGGFIVAWASNQNRIASDIYGQRYDASGVAVMTQQLPSPSPIPAPYTPSPSQSSSSSPGSSVAQTVLQPISLSTQSPSSNTASPLSANMSPSSSVSRVSSILSITIISYGSDYPITINGVNVGTFQITGGSGLVSGSSSNVLTIHLDPDADTQGTFTLFTIPSGQEGQFQSLELVGESCQSFEGSTATDGSGQTTYQMIYQQDTCASAARPVSVFFPTTMLKV